MPFCMDPDLSSFMSVKWYVGKKPTYDFTFHKYTHTRMYGRSVEFLILWSSHYRSKLLPNFVYIKILDFL
jgi:hypothetical protein